MTKSGDAQIPDAASTRFPSDIDLPRVIRDAVSGAFVGTAVQRMQKVARLTNAIYLQQSIVDGSFPSEDVFSELLRMGQLTPSDVRNIDVAAIQKSLESMADLNLPATPNVDKFFALVEGVENAVEGMEDLKNWKRGDFEEEMKGLEKFAVPFLKQMSGLLGDWASAYRQLTEGAQDSKLKTYFEQLKSNSEGILNIILSPAPDPKFTFEFTKIQSATSGFSSVTKAVNGVELYGGIGFKEREVFSDNEKLSVNSENFKAVETAAESIIVIKPVLSKIQSLYEDQKFKKRRVLYTTIGFPNGFEDLGTGHSYLEDAWIQKVVKSSELPKALEPLIDLKTKLESTASSFGKLESGQLKQMDNMLNFITQLKFVGLPKPSEAESKIRQCVKNNTNFDQTDAYINMREIAAELVKVDATILDMNNLVWKVIEEMKTNEIKVGLEKAIQLSANLTTEEELRKASALLKSDPMMTEVYEKLHAVNLEPDEPKKVKGAAKKIISKLESFDPFMTAVSERSEVFTCIQENSPAVTSMIQIIKKLRVLKKDSPMITEVVEVLEKVKETTGLLDALDTYIAKVKKTPSTETMILSSQMKLKKHSTVIGTATKGVVTMFDVIREPLVFDEKRWSRLIENQKRKVAIPLDDSTVKMLNAVVGINKSIADMEKELANWIKHATDRGRIELAAYEDFFGLAANVNGINTDFSSIIAAVKALKKAIPAASPTTSSSQNKRAVGQRDTLDDLISELDTFASIGLHFSDYKTVFEGAKDSLRALDQFFSDFAKAVKAKKLSTSSSGGGKQGTQAVTSLPGDSAAFAADASSTTEPSEDKTMLVVYIVFGVVGTLTITGLIIFFVWRCRKNRKRKPKNSDESKGSTSVESTTTGAESRATTAESRTSTAESTAPAGTPKIATPMNDKKTNGLVQQEEGEAQAARQEVAKARQEVAKAKQEVAAAKQETVAAKKLFQRAHACSQTALQLAENHQKENQRLRKENEEKDRIIKEKDAAMKKLLFENCCLDFHKRGAEALVEQLKENRRLTLQSFQFDALAYKDSQNPEKRVPPLKWKRATSYFKEYYELVKVFGAKRLHDEKERLKAEGRDPTEAQGMRDEDAFEQIYRNILNIVDMSFVMSDNLDPIKYENEIRNKGYGLQEASKIKVKKAPRGWFPTNFMHASKVEMPNLRSMILCQSPQASNKETGVVGNIDKFLWMIHEQNASYVVMLCPLTEKNGKNTCDAYFADNENEKVRFEHCEVTCLSKITHEGYTVRQQLVKFDNKEEHRFAHLQYDWPDKSAPASPGVVLQMLRQVRNSSNPIVVHCSDGIGASGTFAFIELGYQTVSLTGRMPANSILSILRDKRGGAVRNVTQLAFGVTAIMELAMEAGTPEEKADEAARRQELLNWYADMHARVAVREAELDAERETAREAERIAAKQEKQTLATAAAKDA